MGEAASLTEAMKTSIAEMKLTMEQSMLYQTEITKITTFLGQVAARAAKQTPQG